VFNWSEAIGGWYPSAPGFAAVLVDPVDGAVYGGGLSGSWFRGSSSFSLVNVGGVIEFVGLAADYGVGSQIEPTMIWLSWGFMVGCVFWWIGALCGWLLRSVRGAALAYGGE
jgi:hypothetical protein